MRFGEYQPRYAVYVERGGRMILLARYGSLARAILARDTAYENGAYAFVDVN